MKVILLKDVPKLGRRFDTKDVSSGHALNLLIPQGMAVTATPDARKRLEKQRAKAEAEGKIRQDLLVKNVSGLDGVTVVIQGKANDKGHLFAGLHREAIATELEKQTHLQIDPSSIMLEHPIKEAGVHEIEVSAAGKSVKFKLDIQKA